MEESTFRMRQARRRLLGEGLAVIESGVSAQAWLQDVIEAALAMHGWSLEEFVRDYASGVGDHA
jgi:hypothetical protein